MPDAGLTDGVTEYDAAFHDTYVRQQVVAQVTSSTRPTGVEGRMIAETNTDRTWVYNGSAWQFDGHWSAAARPGVFLTDAAQSIGTSSATNITWGTETLDVDGWTSGGSATLTVPTGWDGLYAIQAYGTWASSPGSSAQLVVKKGAAAIGVGFTSVTSLFASVSVAGIALAATDTLVLEVFQASGGPINFTGSMNVVWLGR